MTHRVIAIGDIHGCAAAFRSLLESIRVRPGDTLVALGDCIDRGPDSCQVIEELLLLRSKCRLMTLLGNHEEMMLKFLDGRPQPDDWLECGGEATLDSYRRATPDGLVPPEHLDFIRTWADFWETETHFFAHGAYHPDQPFAVQRWQTWRWHSLRDSVPGPHRSGKTAILGHTSQKNGEVLDLGHLKCIDTYCWGGGWLTALDVRSEQIWQADADGNIRRETTRGGPFG